MIKLELLYRLQSLDDEKKEIKKELEVNDLAQKMAKIKEEISNFAAEVENEAENLAKLEKKLRKEELKNEELIGAEKKYEKQLYSGDKGSKELKQLQTKIDSVKKEKLELEEDLLNLMMEVEDKAEEIVSLKNKLSNKRNELAELKESYKSKEKRLKEELENIERQKVNIKAELEQELLEKYQKLYQKKHGRAVVKIEDGYCMGCRMSLPLDLIDKVNTGGKVVTCENCNRILYLD